MRAQLHDCRAQFEAIKQHGEASADTLALINALFMLVDIVVAVFLERTTPKTSRNSGLPSSRDGTDDGQTHTEGKSGSRSRGPKARHARSDTLRTVTTTHTSPVTGCRQCGHDLTATACTAHEQRVEIDIVFETVERQVTAEIKTCPRCHTRTKGRFPATMPGPLQYGPGIVAYVVHLLCAQMVSLKRTAAMIQAMTGRLLSEATLLGFVSRLHQALEPWEAAAIGKLLDMPVLHVDETSLRVKFTVVEGFRLTEIAAWAQQHLSAGTQVLCDGLACFNGVTAPGCVHEPMVTGGGKAAVERPECRWVNTIPGNIKSALHATYHAIRPKYAQRYLAEFESRFNRRFDLPDIIPRLLYVALRTPPMPERLLKLRLA